MRHRRGGTAVEFALSFPIFMLCVGGMIDIGWMFMQKSALDSAVHLGCRDGSTQDPGNRNAHMDEVLAHAEEAILEHLAGSAGDCNACIVSTDTIYDYPARSLTCAIESDYVPLFGIAPETRLSSSTVVRMEFQR